MAAKNNVDEMVNHMAKLDINKHQKKIYVIGGISGSRLDEIVSYSVSRGLTTSSLPPSLDRKYFSLVSVKSQIYAVGGRDRNNVPLNTIARLNESQQWARLPVYLLGKRSEAGAAVINNVIYITGGYVNCKTAETFDPSTGVRSRLPNMTIGRWGHESVAIGNRLYVIGGHRFKTYFNSVECLENGHWRNCEGMNRRRAYFGSAVVQDKIYVFGGVGGVCNSKEILRLDSIEMYDTTNDIWTEIGRLNEATSNLSAYLLSDSEVVIVGGLENNKVKNNKIQIFSLGEYSFAKKKHFLNSWCFAHSVIVL